jgi:sugar lactone lactonase YvrE
MAKVELALDSKCILGECPITEASGKVHFVDINKKLIHTLDPQSDDHEIIETPELVGCIVPRAGKGLLAGLQVCKFWQCKCSAAAFTFLIFEHGARYT